jgi:hypothetical protein
MNTLAFNETTFEFRNQYNLGDIPTQKSYYIDCIVDGKLFLRLGVLDYDTQRVSFSNSQFITTSKFGSEEFSFDNCVEVAQYYFKQLNK